MLSIQYRNRILSAQSLPNGQTVVTLPEGSEVDFAPRLEKEARLVPLNHQAEAEAAKVVEIKIEPEGELETALVAALEKILARL